MRRLSPAFWHASANAVEETADLSEPTTFEEAVSVPVLRVIVTTRTLR